MEKTLSMLVESIREQLRPHMTQDVDLSDEWLADQIHDSRAALVPRLYNEGDTFTGWQQHRDYDAELVTSVMIGDYSLKALEPYRIINLDGHLMDGIGFLNIEYLGSLDMLTRSFTRMGLREFINNAHHRYGGSFPIYTIYDKKVIIRNASNMERFHVSAIYANPTVVNGYDWDNTFYPLPLTQHRKMEIILFQHLGPKLQMPTDILNNMLDETKNAPVTNQVRQAPTDNEQ